MTHQALVPPNFLCLVAMYMLLGRVLRPTAPTSYLHKAQMMEIRRLIRGLLRSLHASTEIEANR